MFQYSRYQPLLIKDSVFDKVMFDLPLRIIKLVAMQVLYVVDCLFQCLKFMVNLPAKFIVFLLPW